MGQALYRKYRSKKLSEVIGQDHVTSTLDSALKQGKVSHAYLFTGPRGVGKTSVARILAHEVNDLDYVDDSQHLDIIEIDAASNRRIDEIRELREKVYIAPSESRYKVYIIDEVHMLTKEAFNALLKTLEEPPEHVIFILATTDAHKVPATIVSRTQRFSFRPVERDAVAKHLKTISKREKIDIDDDSLEMLADFGEGSIRDSISMLDQVAGLGERITPEKLQALLGIPSEASIDELISGLETGAGAGRIVKLIDTLYQQGMQASSIAERLAVKIRQNLLSGKLLLSKKTALDLLNDLLGVPISHDPSRQLEITLLRYLPEAANPPSAEVTDATRPTPAKEHPQKSDISDTKKDTPKPDSKKESNINPGDTNAIWAEMLSLLKKSHNTLYGVVRMAKPEFGDNSLKLTLQFNFHEKKLKEPSNQKVLVATLKQITKKVYAIDCVVEQKAKKQSETTMKPTADEPPELVTISNIFGGGELVES